MGFWKASARNHGVHIVAILAFLAGTASSALAVSVTLPTNAVIASVGQTTTVDVNVGAVTDLEAVAVSITFDQKIVDVDSGNPDPVTRGTLTAACNSPVMNLLVAGRVTITMPCPQVGGVNGSGMLFRIRFIGKANGMSPLSFSDFMNIPNGCQLNEGTPTCDSSNGMITVGSVGPTGTVTNTAVNTATRTVTNTASSTATATPTNTIGPVATASATRSSTATGSSTATATNTQTRTATATVTDTATIGPSPTPSQTLTASTTPTITFTATPSLSPTASQTPSTTFTASPTLSPAPSLTASQTLTPSTTPTITATGTVTSTASITATRPGIPVIPSPLSPAGLLLVSGLGVALLWAMRRLQS